jgi:hypothetical protein
MAARGTNCYSGVQEAMRQEPWGMLLVWDYCGLSLREIGELFGGAGYTAVAQMIGRTRKKDEKGILQFKLDELMRECVK